MAGEHTRMARAVQNEDQSFRFAQGGERLPEEARQHMEARLGGDFAQVRVHTDQAAHQAAVDLGAEAATVGDHILFRDGHFGSDLLRHELAHVLQQRHETVGGEQIAPGLKLGSERFEREADATGPMVKSGGGTRELVVQRSEVPEGAGEPALGDWRESDRLNWTDTWKKACKHNLENVRRDQYHQVAERRDFYRWFFEEVTKKGHETKWPLAAYAVASGAAEVVDTGGAKEKVSPITNDIQAMVRQGNQVIFDDVLPKLKALWELKDPLKGDAATAWDAHTLAEEQNLIKGVYSEAPEAARTGFGELASGRGARLNAGKTFGLGRIEGFPIEGHPSVIGGEMPNFTGDIMKPEDRWKYGMRVGAHFSAPPTRRRLFRADRAPAPDPTTSMPQVGPDYTGGAALGRVNTMPKLHQLDAFLNDLDVKEREVGDLIRALPANEQRLFDKSPWRLRKLAEALSREEMEYALHLSTHIPDKVKADLIKAAGD
ncbi:DUF4157 domain-containing protein [Allokutzneria sp. A3M-2-11 16]|uniref:eCIS core domain-containing protein n=1 Tax=Allokutzneria sp. A3M-2-11 16 TaxID=2962043 RepID=UPI0020B6B9F3|nr:DUF4157 domain-containing protein [Allokutzneria sp. A3M-2-11 16]MCP3804197.1 DUF4157 domain-containing protein [Allokutzneria sp. A3M-2-11 16]